MKRSLLWLWLFAGGVQAFPWDIDMANQVSIKAQETLVQLPAYSIPVRGLPTALPSGPLEQARGMAATTLQNPTPALEHSVARGRMLFQRHCLSCHGALGRGDGPVGLKFQPKPMNLSLEAVRNQPDGRLYFTISRGSVFMPAYGYAIQSQDRWHLVNYIKHGMTP